MRGRGDEILSHDQLPGCAEVFLGAVCFWLGGRVGPGAFPGTSRMLFREDCVGEKGSLSSAKSSVSAP